MKSWLSALLLVAGLLLATVAAACDGSGGDDGELSLEQYFEQVDTIVAGFRQSTAVIDQPPEQTLDSEEEQIKAYRHAWTTVLPIFREFVDDLDEVDPPEEVADAHGEMVAGFTYSVERFKDFMNQLAEVESAAEFSTISLGPDSELRSAIEQLAAACLQLRSIADDNDIDVDLLECEG